MADPVGASEVAAVGAGVVVGCIVRPLPCPPGQTPRAWQTRALAALKDAAQGAGLRRVVITAATGTGKGTLLAGLVALYTQAGRRVLVLVHRDELIRDLAARCSLVGVTVGIVKGAENGILAPAVVASVQSLKGPRLAQLGRFDLVITDECHHAPADSYQAVYDRVGEVRQALALPEVLHVGLTATPFRTAKGGGVSGLGGAYEAVVYEHGLRQAIEAGDLVTPQAIRVDTHVSLDGLQVRGGDYAEEDLARVIDHDERNQAVAKWYAQNGGGARFLGFGVSIRHAERVAEALQAEGVACEAVHGQLAARVRAQRIEGLRSGRLRGLISRDLLFEGFDAPFVEMLLAIRPTASQIIAQQLLGRGLRLHPGKSSCLVVDFVRYLDVLDLTLLPSLGDGVGAEAVAGSAPSLQPGDLVVHRYDDLGVGQILRLDPQADTLAIVRWRPHEPDAEDRRHGVAELMRAPKSAVDLVPIPLRVTGITETQVQILPGADARRAWPWVAQGAGTRADPRRWVCVWEAHPDADVGGRVSHAVAVVVETATGWVLWVSVKWGRGDDPPTRTFKPRADDYSGREAPPEPGALGRLAAMRRGEAWLMRQAGAAPDLTAAWRQAPASDAQVRRLRALRYGRDLQGLTRGEASALIGAAEGWRAVVAARVENRRAHAIPRAGGNVKHEQGPGAGLFEGVSDGV